MSKRIFILFIVSILTGSVFGQFVGRDDLSVALFYFKKNELDSAKKYVDLASTNDALKATAKTWYYRGFVYKELYKKKDKENKTSAFRIASIDAFEKMLILNDTSEFTQSAAKILKYEAATLYNDAVRMLDLENYKTALSNYALFRKTMLLADAKTNMVVRDVKFKLALASMLSQPLDSVSRVDSIKTYQVKKLYSEVLAMDVNNPGANYNLGILYYNEAAEIINNMDYDMDIMSLGAVEDYCIEMFLKSLPFMKKSYELEYKRRETLIGMSNIYYGLNDLEKYEAYKKELQDLEKEE